MAGLLQSQFLCGKQAPLARDDAVLAVQQDRVRESEFPGAGCDLADLLLGMRPGIPGEWNQYLDGPVFDPETGLFYVNANDLAWTGALAETNSGNTARRVYQANCANCHGDDRAGDRKSVV